MPITLVYSLIILSLLFFLLEGKPLIKKQLWKELIVAAFFLTVALSYGLEFAMNWNVLPNPNNLLLIVKPISEAFEGFFQVN
ncbi:MAG: hypothetical protein PHC92_04475 [Syntrophomonadaceae bacterium]|nr:hypothetical protein [Syntrophomonadaceae bacterium]MDD3024866.1 hypothetical protein [Syntrophomonadaceae bacterium]